MGNIFNRRASASPPTLTTTCKCLDPVLELPGVLTALCLSFVDVRDRLSHAQFVSRAWHDAIDGGLPGVWHDVSMFMGDAYLAEVVRKSHGCINALKLAWFKTAPQALKDTIHSLCGLRVLHISFSSAIPEQELEFNTVTLLSAFPLLEDINVQKAHGHLNVLVVFPTLQHVKTVCCVGCRTVKDLHNLPALTNLCCVGCVVDTDQEWPARLREVAIYRHRSFNPRIMERIASLQQLTAILTDWSFAYDVVHLSSSFTPPFDQLSFLPSCTTLHRLTVDLSGDQGLVTALFNYLGAMTSLRELHIANARIADQDMEFLSQQLVNLTDLSLHRIKQLTSLGLQHPSNLPNLCCLALHCKKVTDYSSVASCARLTALRVKHRYNISAAETHAIAQLQHLEVLRVSARFADLESLSQLCTMRSLRVLDIKDKTWVPPHHNCQFIPVTVFATLPTLSRLESFSLRVCHMRLETGGCLQYGELSSAGAEAGNHRIACTGLDGKQRE